MTAEQTAAVTPAVKITDLHKSYGDVEVLKGINVEVLPGAGHDVHLDAPERVAELVQGFAA